MGARRDEADPTMALAARLVVGVDREQARELALRAGVGLEGDGVVAGDLAQPRRQVVDEGADALGLLRRRERVEVGELRPGDRLHLRGGVELHGARAERDHAAVEREVAVGEAAQVAQHRRLGVVRVEDRVGEELGRARQTLGYAVCPRPADAGRHVVGRLHAEGVEDRVHRCGRGRLVEAERDAVGVDAPDVDAPVGEGGRDLVRTTRHDDRERVEERRRLDVEAAVDQGAAQGGGEGAHARRDGHESGRTVPHGIHARHDGEEHLRRADVGGRLLAADVLLARLQGQPVGLVALGVDGDADEAAGDLALETAVDGHVAGVRTPEAHRDAEALRAADGDVGAPLSRGAGQGEREQVGTGRDEALGLVDGRRQGRPVDDLAGRVGVLHQCPDDSLAVGGGGQGVGVGHAAQVGDEQGQSEGLGARAHHGDGLREESLVDEHDGVGGCLAGAAHQRHRLRRGGRLVEERRACDVEPGEVGDDRLEVEQGLEAPLGDLGLVGRVGGVPGGVLQDVAAHDRRRHGAVVAQADE